MQIKNYFIKLIGIKTIGARALVIKNNQVLLIKHTYVLGWYTIGGGVGKKETPQEAIIRELFEEVGITVMESPTLFGIYYNDVEKRNDYIAFYIVENFEIIERKCFEIAEKKWFSLENLPPDITPATKRRIEEYMGIRKITEKW